jgi:hypothetical protein
MFSMGMWKVSISSSGSESTQSPWMTISLPPVAVSDTDDPQAKALPSAFATSLIFRSAEWTKHALALEAPVNDALVSLRALSS